MAAGSNTLRPQHMVESRARNHTTPSVVERSHRCNAAVRSTMASPAIRSESSSSASTAMSSRRSAPLEESTPFAQDMRLARHRIGERPPTNRGVPSPSQEAVGFDWLGLTLPHLNSMSSLMPAGDVVRHGVNGRYRGVDEWQEDGTGAWIGTGRQADCWVTYVDLPGDALRARNMTGSGALQLLAEMEAIGGHARRVDLAVDLPGDLAPSYQLVRSGLADDCVATHADSWFEYVPHRFDGEPAGWTIYIGSPASESRMRIYDKQAERLSAGCDDTGPWVRVEGQFRGDVAHALALQSLKGVPCGPMLARVARWLCRPRDAHPERIQTAPWFRPVAESSNPLGLTRAATPATAERLAWITESVAGSLAEATEAESEQWLLDVARKRALKVDPKRSARVAAYRAERGGLSR